MNDSTNDKLPLPQARCLNRVQAAEYLGIGTTLLSQLNLTAIRFGKRILFDRLDLDVWLDEYKSRGRAIKEVVKWPEKKDSINVRTRRTGGSMSFSQTDAEYAKVLDLET